MVSQQIQEALRCGGESCELRYADGRVISAYYNGARVFIESSGEALAHPAPAARLTDAISQGGLRPLLSVFSGAPELDALVLKDGRDPAHAVELRVLRQPGTLPAKAALAWRVGGLRGGAVEGPLQEAEEYLPKAQGPRSVRPLSPEEARVALRVLDQPLWVGLHEGEARLFDEPLSPEEITGKIPAVRPESLGAAGFRRLFGLRYAYLSGAMAGGIGSVALAAAMGQAGYMGFYGAGGVPLPKVEEAILALQRELPEGQPFGMNLLHNPFEPKIEEETVALYLKHGVRCIDAAAYMNLSPWVVWYRAAGMRLGAAGELIIPNRVVAKVSRAEVASHFVNPPPEKLLRELVGLGKLTEEEARLAALAPVADALTAEADSGGHTDRRPLPVLIPLMLKTRAAAMAQHGYAARGLAIYVGAAGGVAEPLSARAAFALGADYVLTGSLNQACVEADSSPLVKKMLAEADMADVGMAPAPDMFEIGAQVQVLKRGTLYPARAQKLYELYRGYERFSDVPAEERAKVEKQILRRPYDEVWADTAKYWEARDPKVYADALKSERTQMALTFRWYLGMSSRWARLGDESRKLDFQVWCGPAIGAFNRWVKGSALDPIEARRAPDVAREILRGAAALARLEIARAFSVHGLPSAEDLASLA